MFKTLKGKFSFVYICLVLTIGFVGITSALKLYSLNKSIDGLMDDNYKSIQAAHRMLNAIENQNNAIINYIYYQQPESLDVINKNSNDFYKWSNIELNNITEKGEKDTIDKINSLYTEYTKTLAQIQDIKNKKSLNDPMDYYKTNLITIYNGLKENLNNLTLINEKAMFLSKNTVVNHTQKSMYLTLILSIITVILGYILSRFFINKYLNPIYTLTENIKLIKEGNLNQQVPITTEDEIGILAKEFNNMTSRLYIFEKSAKGKLLAEKNRSVTIVKSIPDPLIVLDSNYKIVLLNDACESFFDIKEEKTINKYLLNSVRNTDLLDHIIEVIEKKCEINQKIIKFENNNKTFFFNVIVTAAKDKELNINDIVVVFQDITKLKKLENIKSNFISTVSHEFKTPLNSIMLGTSLILDENVGELNDKQKEIIDTIKEDGDKLASLVINLLQLTRLESDKSLFNMHPSSIVGIIDDSFRNFYDIANSKDVNLYYEMDENLPLVNVDGEKISWVINNLISNALKFTNAGDQICVETYRSNDKLLIRVKDTGIGIPEPYLKKIFDKFVQIPNHDSETIGTGLGLSIAKEIVEAHGGEIWCESVIDDGSTFTFTLPVI